MQIARMEPNGTLKQVLKTSFPAAIDLSSQTVTWLIEAVFMGQLSAFALAGVGIAQQFIILTFSVLLTFVVGSSIIIVRYLGAKDAWNANHVLGQALFIGFLLSALISVFWYFMVPLMFHLLRDDSSMARYYATVYIETIAYFAPVIITNFIALGILRGVGETVLTMTISLIVNSINIILDILLIFGMFGFPRLETRGAALAVGIAHSIGLIITLVYLRNRRTCLFLSVMEITSPRIETVKRLFKLGVPTTIEQLVWSLGQIVLSFFAAGISITALAAHQALVRIQSVLAMVNWGFAVAGMTLVGKSIGANDTVEAHRSGRMVALVSFFNAAMVSILLYFFADEALAVFTDDAQVVALGKTILLAFVLLQIPKAVNTAYSGNLRGSADLNWLMWMAIGAVIINECTGAYILTFMMGMGLLGLWVIQIIDESGRLALNIWRFNRGDWKNIH
jgi:putative MATE family efflux protein